MSQKVFVAMSGGVDSTGAALLLQQAGYEVSGVTLLMHHLSDSTASAVEDAKSAAATLGISHTVLDFSELFQRTVMDHFVSEYVHGRTPNPCIDCNRCVKFGALLDWAVAQGADYLATGHYARVTRGASGGKWQLLRGQDRKKDQSYFLYQLTQEQLSHLLFPVGAYEKPAIRAAAAAAGLRNASRRDSQDICFIPGGDYMSFLTAHGDVHPLPGNFVDQAGHVLGRHRGLECYTIGQRKGLGVSANEPVYVLSKNLEAGEVVLGPDSALFQRQLTAERVNWVCGEPPLQPLRATVKTRYSQREAIATVEPLPENRVRVTFEDPQRAITAGQAVVFYQGEAVLGGGTIL